MVPFNPVLLSVVGSNAWSHLHPCTFVCCGVKLILPFRPVLLSVVGSNPWSDLHPVLVMKSMVPFTPCTCCVYCGIYMLYVSVAESNPWSHLHPVPVIKSMVTFTPCTCVFCGFKSVVRFTPCTCDQIHGPIYTLYL